VERAAGSERAASEARLQQERLKEQLAWRAISPTVLAELTRLLALHRGSLVLAYTANDPEALYLAIQLSKAFANASWQATAESRTYASRIIFGITIPGDSADAVNIRSAFSAVGIPFAVDPVPPPDMSFGASTAPPPTIVMIGSKPPPF